ncbi:hypothetical protein FACS1894198_4820 [Clostridia bacterium]|nr:hypothetical protein FACS1894198_4820 [Clostridia bacterium]
MEIFKKAAVKYAVLLVLLVGVGAGVGYYFWPSADNVASYGGEKISAEVYKGLQHQAFNHVFGEIEKTKMTDKAVIEQFQKAMGNMGKICDINVDGKTVESMIAEASKDKVYRFAAVEAMFAEKKLTLPKEDQADLDQQKKQMEEAEKAAAEAKAKGKQTAREAEKAAEAKKQGEADLASMQNSYKRNAIFKSLYGEKGTEKLSDAELKKGFDSKYVKVRVFGIAYDDTKGTKDAKEETKEAGTKKDIDTKEEAKKRAENYVKEIGATGFGKVAVKEDARVQAQSEQKSESKETEEEKIKRLSQAQIVPKEGLEPSLKTLLESTSLNKADHS